MSLKLKNKCLLYFTCSNSKHFINYISLPRFLGAGWGMGVDEKVGIPPATNLDKKWMKGDSKRNSSHSEPNAYGKGIKFKVQNIHFLEILVIHYKDCLNSAKENSPFNHPEQS